MTDIALHTITIRNWTIRSPVSRPRISSPRPIQLAGEVLLRQRRIACSIAIDQHSVRFLDQRCSPGMLTIRGVSEPPATLLRRPGLCGVADCWFVDNGHQPGPARHHLMHPSAERPDIIKEMAIVVRTLKPSLFGHPVEIYCFTTNAVERLRKYPAHDI
ncbi:hypothetical protein MJ561_08565 [Klebsiella pneumoniae]|nr:hypothetical protein MJ561_08565 [Klebsiella pneumoniae]